MEKLNLQEQARIAKVCAKKGMPLSDLAKIGIDIHEFSLEEQAELHGISAANRIDKSIRMALEEEQER